MKYNIDAFPGSTMVQNGKTYTYFGGTAYLGLQTDTAFQQLFIENVKKYGTDYSASRTANVRISIYEKAETFLANRSGSEACLTVSSGYLAGQLVRAHFNTAAYKSFHAPGTHPALHGQHTKNYGSFEALHTAITAQLHKTPSVTPVVYFDTVDFQGNNYPDFRGLKALPLEKIILVADDSHGLGILGSRGEGAFGMLQALKSKALVVCGSLGKGFGIQAGGILGTQSLIHALKRRDMFAAASPAAPCALATFLQAQAIYAQKRQLLLQHIKTFSKGVEALSQFRYMKDYPTFTYTDEALSDHLLGHHIVVTNFKYPNEHADTVSRIVLSAHHTDTDILNLIAAVNRYPTKHQR